MKKIFLPLLALICFSVQAQRVPTFHTVIFFSSRRRHTRSTRDWSSDVCSSDLVLLATPGAASKTPGTKKARVTPVSLDPTIQLGLLRASEDTKYTGTGRNIFQAEVEIPKPVAPAVPEIQVAEAPPPPPPPPPLPLKFFGFASKPGEPKRIFLSKGEDVFIAGEGEIVDRRYKVLHIGPASVEIEDVLNNNRQSIPLTQG